MSLFKKAEEKPTRLKAFVYGETGTGKTITALSFPKPAVVDTEKGTTHYGKYKEFYVLPAKDPKTIHAALDELLLDPKGFKTFVLDSFTVVYEAIVLAVENRMKAKTGNPNYSIQPPDYKIVKSEMKNLIHKMISLDMNLIVTARAKKKYAQGEFMKEEGIAPDIPDYVPYEFDVNIELHRDQNTSTAEVIKDRTNTLPPSFEYSYEKFVEFMGIEGLEREPLVINQQKELTSSDPRQTEIVFNGDKIKTAGVTADQLTMISELVDTGDPDVIQRKLKDLFYADSFLDLSEDEAKSFIEKIKDLEDEEDK